VLAQRLLLAQLPPQPAEEAHPGGAAYRLKDQISSLSATAKPSCR
jgi:hypothetical protein